MKGKQKKDEIKKKKKKKKEISQITPWKKIVWTWQAQLNLSQLPLLYSNTFTTVTCRFTEYAGQYWQNELQMYLMGWSLSKLTIV